MPVIDTLNHYFLSFILPLRHRHFFLNVPATGCFHSCEAINFFGLSLDDLGNDFERGYVRLSRLALFNLFTCDVCQSSVEAGLVKGLDWLAATKMNVLSVFFNTTLDSIFMLEVDLNRTRYNHEKFHKSF